jgi:hypothetical protein
MHLYVYQHHFQRLKTNDATMADRDRDEYSDQLHATLEFLRAHFPQAADVVIHNLEEEERQATGAQAGRASQQDADAAAQGAYKEHLEQQTGEEQRAKSAGPMGTRCVRVGLRSRDLDRGARDAVPALCCRFAAFAPRCCTSFWHRAVDVTPPPTHTTPSLPHNIKVCGRRRRWRLERPRRR